MSETAAISTGICTCSMHCTRSAYHERACCDGPLCNCWCHEPRDKKAKGGA